MLFAINFLDLQKNKIMLPDKSCIKIDNNLHLVEEFIQEIIVSPKHLLKKWSEITNQTPAAKLGYIGQHLASLITGVPGTGSGARGDDLLDGSEVKSCNKVDQADKCKDCGHRVMRYQNECPYCGSKNIERKDDSKWLFTIRSEEELNQYLRMDRVVLILMDYPNFSDNDFRDIRISCFEIYPKEPRMSVFCDLIKNHYYNIYRPKADRGEKTNPMNLHPFLFQFYKCNPIKTFECIVKDIDRDAKIIIDKDNYISPLVERDSSFKTIDMPSSLLKSNEWEYLIDKADFDNEIRPLMTKKFSKEQFSRLSKKNKEKNLPFLDERLRDYIPLRDIVSVHQKSIYDRSKDRL